MVNPVQRIGGGSPVAALPLATTDTPFPSPNAPPNWFTVPSLSSNIMNPDTGATGIPWYNLLIFMSTRASFIDQLNSEVTQLQQQVSTLQSQVATIQAQISTLQGDVTTLQGQVATIQGQITTIQGQIAFIEANFAPLNSPVFIGTPEAPTPALGNNSTLIATTAFVNSEINSIIAAGTGIPQLAFASLPSPAGIAGAKRYVTDSSVIAFYSVVAGGGTNFVPAFSDGTDWRVG